MPGYTTTRDTTPEQRAHYSVGQHAAKPTPARAWGKRSGSDKSGRRDGLPLAFNHAGRSQLCHAIPEPGGHGRTREDTTRSAIEYWRTRKEPPGYGRTPLCRFGTVRPPVQIPGPRPFLYSKSAISGVVLNRRGTAGAQFPGERCHLGVRW